MTIVSLAVATLLTAITLIGSPTTAGAAPWAGCASYTPQYLAVSPTSVVAGGSVTVTGTVQPGDLVTIKLLNPPNAPVTLGTTTAAPNGTFSKAVTIPATLLPGTYTLSVTSTQCPTPGTVSITVNQYACASVNVNSADFNTTKIPGNRYIWFSAVAQVSGVGSTPVTIQATNSTIKVQTTTYSIPNTKLTIDPNATAATTTFDSASNTWITVVPKSASGNQYLTGFTLPVGAAGLPASITGVTWTTRFMTVTPGITLNWQWSAALYSSFSTNYNALNVKPTDSSTASSYKNSDRAGTPEVYKAYLAAGARGTGGTNYTGTLTSAMGCTLGTLISAILPPSSGRWMPSMDQPVQARAAFVLLIALVGAAELLVLRRRRRRGSRFEQPSLAT